MSLCPIKRSKKREVFFGCHVLRWILSGHDEPCKSKGNYKVGTKGQRHRGTKQTMKMYRDLIVWQKAMRFVTEIYRCTTAYPQEKAFGLTSQTKRFVDFEREYLRDK